MENKILATVNGKEITENDLNMAMTRFPQENQAFFATEQGKAQLLEQLISFELVSKYAADEKLDETEEYKEQLEILKKDLLIQAGVKKVLDAVTVTDEEVKAFYDNNPNMFKGEASVRAKHILVDSEEKAKEVKASIDGGVSFEEAAQKNSSCPSSSQGGDLGFFTRGRMVPEFEEAAFELAIGEVSEPVKTQFGYHLIKVEEKTAEVTKSFDEVKDQLKVNLLSQKQNATYLNFINKLKQEQEVKMGQ
ncbi:peptidylprolyl isomerase [Clostridium culturomicium]|uniref:peptidylprolyl isomerase n=1 Tax=Clostridium culturomicium TaxID=1499683 RepID=UPI003857A78F